jgi:uracil-DNA glycosylase
MIPDRLHDEIAAWLDFYHELGIDDFFIEQRRLADSRGALRAALSSPPASSPITTPAVEGSPPMAGPIVEVTGDAAESSAPISAASLRPPTAARSLHLFDAESSRRRERESLDDVQRDLGDCQRCKLAPGRKHIVFGQGNPRAELVFVGEGPGADEDEQGLPFVGRAGQLLNRLLEGVGIRRQDVYICNVVKCRPPGNRTPERDEVEACSPFLFRQIEAIQPRLVCCLGAPAVRTVLGLKDGILKLRGRFYDFGSARALATVHPAYVLRNPREEKILREDFEKIRDFLSK